MAKEVVKVAIANQTEKNFDVDVVEKWVPTEITNIRDFVIFKHEDTYYSMKRVDFQKIYKQ